MRNHKNLPAFLEAEIQQGKSVEIFRVVAGKRKSSMVCSPRVVARIKGILGEPLNEKPIFKDECIRTTFRSNLGRTIYYHAYSTKTALSINEVLLAYALKQHKRDKRALRINEAKLASRGYYLGPHQRTVAPARQSDPGIPFIGDVPRDKWEGTGLFFWVIPPRTASGMENVLPAGTGVALKEIHSSKELIPGAVYVYWVDNMTGPIAGRLLPRSRDQVHLHIRYDDADRHARYGEPTCWIDWKEPTIHICQVMYYTAQPAKIK